MADLVYVERKIKKMKKIHFILSLVLSVCMMLSIGASVIAAEPDNKVPEKVQALYEKMIQLEDEELELFFKNLSPEDQKLVITILTPSTTEKETTFSQSKDTQTTMTSTSRLKNIFGMVLCEYTQVLTWVWNGTYVTQDPQLTISGDANSFWTYLGVLSQYEYGGQGYTYCRAFSQGSFEMRILGEVAQTWYPVIDQYGYGDGTFAVY